MDKTHMNISEHLITSFVSAETTRILFPYDWEHAEEPDRKALLSEIYQTADRAGKDTEPIADIIAYFAPTSCTRGIFEITAYFADKDSLTACIEVKSEQIKEVVSTFLQMDAPGIRDDFKTCIANATALLKKGYQPQQILAALGE